MKRKGLVSIAFFSLLLFMFAGCQEIRKYAQITNEKGTSAAYRKALNKWTRANTIYSVFETKAALHVTYKSKRFLDAGSAEYARIYDLPEQQANKNVTTDAHSGYEFIFYAYTPVNEANDFEKTGSSWKIHLFAGEERLEPVEIKMIEPITPEMELFYPYIQSRYGKLYSLKFPASSRSNVPLKLIFVGPLGRLELDW